MAVITEQLLSMLGVDSAELEVYSGGLYAVIQRDPQPDEEGIDQSTNVKMMIVDLEGDPADVSLGFDFDVHVDGQLILNYVSGVPSWSNGFTGTVSASSVDDPYFRYFVDAEQVSPPIFTSEQVVDVRVVLNPSLPYLDTTYQFTVEDLTPPSIISAESISQHVVRIGFDDEMAVSGSGSAMRPEAYTVETLNEDPVPGVSLEVVAVTAVDSSGNTEFDLEFQWEQTPGCLYRINVDPSVTDSNGNPIQ